ncbi:hypothetical protein QE152_g33152 [Popillia japonica]|uniref:Uncharacterized protein n=1 Tax=Popillia japonica TaxID=7064 RepID=A0AAW1IYB2_POPJA
MKEQRSLYNSSPCLKPRATENAPDALTKSFSNGLVHGHGYFEQKASSTKQLSIEVSELHVGEDGELRLTCMSTIPGYINDNEDYADIKKHSVRLFIETPEEPEELTMPSRGTTWRYTTSISAIVAIIANTLF